MERNEHYDYYLVHVVKIYTRLQLPPEMLRYIQNLVQKSSEACLSNEMFQNIMEIRTASMPVQPQVPKEKLTNQKIEKAILAAMLMAVEPKAVRWMGIWIAWNRHTDLLPPMANFKEFKKRMLKLREEHTFLPEWVSRYECYKSDPYMIDLRFPISNWNVNDWKDRSQDHWQERYEYSHLKAIGAVALRFLQNLGISE